MTRLQRVVLVLGLGLALLLGACAAPTRSGGTLDCSNPFNAGKGNCPALATATPEATPTPVPTPTPSYITREQSPELQAALTELYNRGYGESIISVEGIAPGTTVTTVISGTSVSVQMNAVGLTMRPPDIANALMLLGVLKMDDAEFEANGNYNCPRLDAPANGPTNDQGKPILTDVFFPGSRDLYVYACGPGMRVLDYDGWVTILLMDPADRGPITIRSGSSVEELQNATPQPVAP
jgi:hypothetical protein